MIRFLFWYKAYVFNFSNTAMALPFFQTKMEIMLRNKKEWICCGEIFILFLKIGLVQPILGYYMS